MRALIVNDVVAQLFEGQMPALHPSLLVVEVPEDTMVGDKFVSGALIKDGNEARIKPKVDAEADLKLAKQDKATELKAKRHQAFIGNVSIEGVEYSLARDYNGIAALASVFFLDAKRQVSFETEFNGFIALDRASWEKLFKAMNEYVQNVFDHAKRLSDQIERKLKVETVESIDLDADWPSREL